ncbi:MAG: hypothetical protein ACRC42_01420 [Mycoplasma sp.]
MKKQDQSKENLLASTSGYNKVPGIFVYEEAREKLNISKRGKIYRQKFSAYLPVVGPLCSMVYANAVIGKTKCLRKEDAKIFKGLNKWINLFGFLFWPIIFFGMWALLTVLIMQFYNGAPVTEFGKNYADLWTAILAEINVTGFNETILSAISIIIAGVAEIAFVPFGEFIGGVQANFNIGGFLIQTNIVFLVSMLLFTMINPVNIYNTIAFAGQRKEFIVVLEEDTVYQFRSERVN